MSIPNTVIGAAPHPGEYIKEELLDPMGLSVYAVAKAIGVPRSRLSDIVHGRQNITAPMALRLGKFFGMSPQFFINYQLMHDLYVATQTMGDEIAAIEPHRPEATKRHTRHAA